MRRASTLNFNAMRERQKLEVNNYGSDGAQQIARYFNMSCITYNNSRNVVLEQTVYAWMVTNIGDSVIVVNGKKLFPSATPTTSAGDALVIGAHVLDFYRGTLTIAVAVGTAAPSYEVTQLFYAESYKQ